jgi:CCR4-NOT transcription complex subunit 2
VNSEFPSLSNNQTQPSQSTWAAQSARSVGQSTSMRPQASISLSAQQQTQQQQEDLFTSSSQLPSSQGGFRFGNQNAVGQSASHTQSVDEFPPLSRNASGDIGQDRGSNLIQNVGFGAQANGMGFSSTNPPQPNRNNGLLNVLSGNNRVGSTNRVSSPSIGW